jgi:hypothetical protein
MTITTEEEYRAALVRVDELWSAATGTPEAQELDELAETIDTYEAPERARRLAPRRHQRRRLDGPALDSSNDWLWAIFHGQPHHSTRWEAGAGRMPRRLFQQALRQAQRTHRWGRAVFIGPWPKARPVPGPGYGVPKDTGRRQRDATWRALAKGWRERKRRPSTRTFRRDRL